MTHVVEEWGIEYPDHYEEDFHSRAHAKLYRDTHPCPGARIVGRIHLIGDWTPDEDDTPTKEKK